MIFDPFAGGQAGRTGSEQKKRAFLVGTGKGRVHFLAKIALYRGQSINCYHLITRERRKLQGRNTPDFEAIRDGFMKDGIEVPYPSDIPEADVQRWVDFGRGEAKKRGLEIHE